MTGEIGSVTPRRRTRLRGEIVSVVHCTRPNVRTDVTIGDGTGVLMLRFVGRSAMPGFDVGRHVVVEGTAGPIHGDLVMVNPVYSFVSCVQGVD